MAAAGESKWEPIEFQSRKGIAEIQGDPPDAPSNRVTFGATVTVQDKKGATETFTILGVDELKFERDVVSWISAVGNALLPADMGDWITLEDGEAPKL